MRKSWMLGGALLLIVLGACLFLYWDSRQIGNSSRPSQVGAQGDEPGADNGSTSHVMPDRNTPVGDNTANRNSNPDSPKTNTPDPTVSDTQPQHPPRPIRFRENSEAGTPLFQPLQGWLASEKLNVQGAKVSKGGDAVFVDIDKKQWITRLSEFSPIDSDGVFDIELKVQNFDGTPADGKALSLTVIRTRDSAAWSVECPSTRLGVLRMLVPVAEGDEFQLQVKSGDGTTVLAHIPCQLVRGRNLANRPVYDLYRRGRVSLEVRLIPSDVKPHARSLMIADSQGRPIRDAVVLREGQELGRSGVDGLIEWPLLPTSARPTGIPAARSWPPLDELVFVMHAPGYAPVMLTRGEVEQADLGALNVVMRAPEFVATVYAPVSDERCLYLQMFYRKKDGSVSRGSDILQANWDLLPLRPEMTVKDWPTAYRELLRYNQSDEQWALYNRVTRNSPSMDPFSRDRMPPQVSPFSRGDSESINETWADGLEQAIGRPYSFYWRMVYGGWYFRRWRYKDGRFDVALPYPGKFLLLVGEEFRENATHSSMGQINHVLYIDATDQDNVKGELFRCPG